MCSVRFTLTTHSRRAVEDRLKTAQQQANLRQVKDLLAILAVGDGRSFVEVAVVLRVHEKTIAAWVHGFYCDGIRGAPRPKPTGRPPKLTPTQKASLATLTDEGPLHAGFSSACWRSPMIQQLIDDRFGVFHNIFYIAQFLKNLGFSYQKAAFVSDHLNEAKRQEGCTTTWPQILRWAKAQHALLLFGDEASFPKWGMLSYTWARRGHQPMVKTSGKRKGSKVFGVIEYCTGRFWYQGQEGPFGAWEVHDTFAQVFPKSAPLHLDAWHLDDARAQITRLIASTQTAPRCPGCAVPARRVHSRYSRTLADLPWSGDAVT
jgi:transposase